MVCVIGAVLARGLVQKGRRRRGRSDNGDPLDVLAPQVFHRFVQRAVTWSSGLECGR
jgi:hypothetical protein